MGILSSNSCRTNSCSSKDILTSNSRPTYCQAATSIVLTVVEIPSVVVWLITPCNPLCGDWGTYFLELQMWRAKGSSILLLNVSTHVPDYVASYNQRRSPQYQTSALHNELLQNNCTKSVFKGAIGLWYATTRISFEIGGYWAMTRNSVESSPLQFAVDDVVIPTQHAETCIFYITWSSLPSGHFNVVSRIYELWQEAEVYSSVQMSIKLPNFCCNAEWIKILYISTHTHTRERGVSKRALQLQKLI
jgi:hypothetical protein